MPNAKGGKKFKRGKKGGPQEKRFIYKDPAEDQEYGKVCRAMGSGRFEIQCFDGKMRMGIVAGNMRKRVWINKDDIILFSKWEFTTEDDKCSIVHKYDLDESRKLQREGEFPDFIKLEEDLGEDDIDFQFSNEDNESNPSEEEEEEEEIDLDDI
jgi:translation initiation factor 1A